MECLTQRELTFPSWELNWHLAGVLLGRGGSATALGGRFTRWPLGGDRHTFFGFYETVAKVQSGGEAHVGVQQTLSQEPSRQCH